MTPGPDDRRLPRDSLPTWLCTSGFSLSLGMASVAMPLLALQAGYSGTEIGVYTALSAVAQLCTRLVMGPAMRLLPDRDFIVLAAALLAVSSGLAAVSALPICFGLAQLLQGIARAFFWTGSQTHAVRMSKSSVRGLTALNLSSTAGLLGGPVLAGFLTEASPGRALLCAALIATVVMWPAARLTRLPVFEQLEDRRPGLIWTRPGVDAGCWAGVTAGAWRGLLSSYIPVVLTHAGQGPSMVGGLVSVANAASLAGTGLAGRVPERWLSRSFGLGVLATGLSIAAFAPLAATALAAGAALAASGIGAGVLQTVGPAVASDAVHPEERGEAIAAAGTFRAASLFLVPLGVAGLLAVVPLVPALMLTGVLAATPAGYTPRLRRHLGGR
ncbi:MFS transporter [Actinomadura sp. SCN-SB]|uniref:MFS transporter n=1 Tax=Actinomadura sp. SCN-SB TaxID=3373092 RepID=UPI0037502149